jgi:hypothetical protein
MKPEKLIYFGLHFFKSLQALIGVLFLFFPVNGQLARTEPTQDSIRGTNKPEIVRHINIPTVSTVNLFSSHVVPSLNLSYDRSSLFYDSLKIRASKTLVTKKLYDFLVTPRSHPAEKQISGSSESGFRIYKGKRIRNIIINRLDVFGTSLQRPDEFNPNNLEKLLNKTHVNTNEYIIRKNLLFSKGDSVSPLQLSDNERILRQLPFINDARIIVEPVSENEVDIKVLTKDVYSLGAGFNLHGIKSGTASVYDKNIFGMGHEFGVEIPWNSQLNDSPGFGVKYLINNIAKSFLNLDLFYYDGLGKRTYGFDLLRNLVSSATKYAGGISIRQMNTSEKVDSVMVPAPVKYNLQDYWLLRSFLIDQVSVSRIIIGARYTNNNVFDHPFITSDSYHNLQRYKMYLASAGFSVQKFYKTNLIYGYGRTEDLPYGGLINFTIGREINEFKIRNYLGSFLSIGESIKSLGYFYSSAGFSSFFNKGKTEQGVILLRTNYISNLIYLGRYKIRNFVNIDYTRGFARYSDEYLSFNHENGFSGFKNDSINGGQRLTFSLESVLFSPVDFYGFRFAFFGFADTGFLFGSNEIVKNSDFFCGVGLGIRIRNDNLVLNTLQIRLAFYPYLPLNSDASHLIISGQQLLHPVNFEPGAPSILPYR